MLEQNTKNNLLVFQMQSAFEQSNQNLKLNRLIRINLWSHMIVVAFAITKNQY